VSTGGSGPGSGQVMFNFAQWAGDYLSAGVTDITAMMKADLDGNPLSMRLALEGNAGSWYASTNAVALPNDGLWHSVSFGLSAAELSLTSGTDTLPTVLANVVELRILSSPGLPPVGLGSGAQGERIAATLHVDNITAVPEPAAIVLVGLSLLGVAIWAWLRP
jgi:hypothetical protein